jgi:hypothetical protein
MCKKKRIYGTKPRQLPQKQYGRIHRTFGVPLLEPYFRREGQKPPPLIEINDT